VGVSNFRPWDMDLLQSRMTARLVTNQIELSLSAHDAFVNGDLAYLHQHRIAPMAWSPLAGGDLSKPGAMREKLDTIGAKVEVDWSAVAVAWLLHHPSGILPVMGTNNLGRIAQISDALKVQMDRQTWFELYTLALGREVA